MILADFQIRALCESGMVSPFDPALLNPASLDLRLGSNILIESAEGPGLVPYCMAHHTADDPYRLVPGQFALAEGEPIFNLPNNIAAQFVLKSSRAREGLEHLLAGFCDPGWHGSRLTLELQNARRLHSVPIWPGIKIGQMVFHKMDAIPARSYAITGRYNQDETVTASKG
jgi:dCTP deaminase